MLKKTIIISGVAVIILVALSFSSLVPASPKTEPRGNSDLNSTLLETKHTQELEVSEVAPEPEEPIFTDSFEGWAWQTFSNSELLPGVTFQYTTFGQVGQISEEQVTPSIVVTTVEIVDSETGTLAPQYSMSFIGNDDQLPLIDWFAQIVDLSGAILAGGGYSLTTLSNEVQVLSLFGYEIPPEHLEVSGPLPGIFAISPSREKIIVIQTNQLQILGTLGITPDDRVNIYFEILETMSFQ